MKKIIYSALILFAVCISCSDNGNEDDATTTAFNVRLTDSPGEYQKVLIDIVGVRVHVGSEDEGEDEEGGWQDLENVNVGVYNLLDFTNGMDTLLVSEDLPVGDISQMRLMLGSNNRIMKEDEYHDLQTPSAQQSGLKLNIHATLEPYIDYNIWLDFDASRSIVKRGNGTYLLKPVIRTYTEATSGGVEGVVSPVDSRPYVMAISSLNDTVGTLADTVTGNFLIKGLEAGDYKIKFEPLSDYLSKEIEDVAVSLGEIHNMGTIEIEAKVGE